MSACLNRRVVLRTACQMLPLLLIYLSVVSLRFAFATSLARSNVLSHAIQDAPSYGQLPIVRLHHPPHNPEEVNGTIYEFLANNPRFVVFPELSAN
jgi:hypothetical protein